MDYKDTFLELYNKQPPLLPPFQRLLCLDKTMCREVGIELAFQEVNTVWLYLVAIHLSSIYLILFPTLQSEELIYELNKYHAQRLRNLTTENRESTLRYLELRQELHHILETLDG